MAIENAKTVERAIRLLFDLADHPGGFTATELAARLDTQRPPLYRLLRTLTEYRLIRRDQFKIYTLSIGVLELARAVAGPLESLARPILQQAADATNATAMLLLSEGDALVTALSITPSTADMHLTTPVGYRHPQGPTAPRLALLAGRPPRDDDPPEVQSARDQGYAVSHGAAFEGQTAFAVAVDLGAGYLAACLTLVTIRQPDEDVVVGALLRGASRMADAFIARR